MAWGVEQVELVGLSVPRVEAQRDGVGFDGNAFFSLEVHGVEVLLLGFTLGDGLGVLEEAVGQGRFAMIDVSDDGEVTGEFDRHGDLVAGG